MYTKVFSYINSNSLKKCDLMSKLKCRYMSFSSLISLYLKIKLDTEIPELPEIAAKFV